MRNVFVAAGVCAVAMAGAPEARADVLSWGLKGAFVGATLKTAGAGGGFDTSADGGFGGGVFVGFEIANGVRFQPEALLTTRRFSAKDASLPFSVSARGFEVPLLFHARFPQGHRAQAVIFGGPQLSVVSNVKMDAAGQPERDVSDLVKDLDAGATLGGGVEIAAGRGAFLAEVRANVGLRDLSEDPAMSIKSRAFMVLAGYRF